MKPLRLCLPMLMAGVISVSSSAMSLFPKPPGEIILRGNLNQTCIPGRGGTVFLQMQLDARDFPLPERAYRPMNISVVLDRSGSMGDERKIVYAKQAIANLVDHLAATDYLSIVIYDDRIETLLPTQQVRDRYRIKRLLEEVFPCGSTNLGGGMQEGFRQIERNFKTEYINRVILLSDGLANQGITDPRDLNRIVNEYRSRGISLSAMGVGLDYNENLMLGLAEHGGGNYYFIESPSQLASIFEKELNGLNYVVVQNARIELMLGDGVTVNDVIGCQHGRDGDRWTIPVGDISANDHREFTVELSIPEGSGKKLWRQKGTGRARVGEIRNPLWRKGGTVFGPQPRSYDYALPKKVERGALRAALAARLQDGSLVVVDGIAQDSTQVHVAGRVRDDADRELSLSMMGYWVRFAASGDPNGDNAPVWPRFDRSTEQALEFGDQVQVRSGMYHETADFFDRVSAERTSGSTGPSR